MAELNICSVFSALQGESSAVVSTAGLGVDAHVHMVLGAATFWKDYSVLSNLQELDQHMIVRPLKLAKSVIEYDKYHYPSEHARVYGFAK